MRLEWTIFLKVSKLVNVHVPYQYYYYFIINIITIYTIRLYKAIVLSTLLYSSETWPMTAANLRRLEAAHHRWQRRILGVTWRDMIRNEEIRRRTGMETIEDVIKKTRLRWLGHLHRMEEDRIPKQAMDWTPNGWKRKKGRPRKNWKDTITRELRDGGLTWEEAAGAAQDRQR